MDIGVGRRERARGPRAGWLRIAALGATLPLISCGSAELSPLIEPTELSFAYEVAPTDLDFGSQPVGGSASQEFTITNTGEADVVVIGVEAPDFDDLDVELDRRIVPSGQARAVRVVWTPSLPGMLQRRVHVDLGATRDTVERAEVTVRGSAIGPRLTISSSEYDFGEVPLGCTGNLNLTVSNSGSAPMRVDRVVLDGETDFRMQLAESLPWVIAPFGSAQVALRYDPDDIGGNAASLTVHSDAGTAQTQLSGLGTVDADERVEFRVAERKPSTILVHVNAVAIHGTSWGSFAERFDAALPTLFEALQDSGVDYRIAFVWDVTGVVDGGEFIDDSYSPSQGRRTALKQIEDGANTNNDRSLTTLLEAIHRNDDWLFEDDYWGDAKLALIAINNDDDTSGLPPATAAAKAREWKEEDEDVVFHSIASFPGSKCGVPHGPYKDVVDLTGGIALDICEADWHDHMRKLVAASVVGGRQRGSYYVPLNGTPLVSSIRVELDGRTLPANWSYDPVSNAVVFDASYAIDGRDVVITYRGSNVCGSG